MVDPVWNASSENSLDYKQVLIDIYGPQAVNIGFVDDATGMKCLSKALKHAALTVSPQTARETYLQDDPNYGTDVMRIQDIESLPCWYGFVYTQNNSEHPLSETLSLELEGLEVDYPRDCIG